MCGHKMIKYKKLKIKNEKEVEELDIDDIITLKSFGDVLFRYTSGTAISYSHLENELQHKVAKLSRKADWMIREYEGELYLIALKKDC